jgi:hypothetical protein
MMVAKFCPVTTLQPAPPTGMVRPLATTAAQEAVQVAVRGSTSAPVVRVGKVRV